MRVAILGYGLEGAAAYRFYERQQADITVFDARPQPKLPLPAGVHFVGSSDFSNLTDFDVVVRTPPINPWKLQTEATITSVTKLFFEQVNKPIIGITGTKGKGTTASLIKAIFDSAGVPAWLVGNIGLPALDLLDEINAAPDGVVVYELSSFQLWDMQQSPHVAVVLMIEPDHLEIHEDMEDYVNAKANICRWQKTGDYVFYQPHNKHSRYIASLSKGQREAFGEVPAAHVDNGTLVIDEQKICSISDLLLPGEHNIQNVCAAVSAAWLYTQDAAAIKTALSTFKGLEHRLEVVADKHGVTYVNDSFSSMPGATEVAIAAFHQPKIVICGGYDRGLSFDSLAQAIAADPTVRSVLLIGQTGPRVAEALAAAGFKNYELLTATTMPAIVAAARERARSGEVVLLSPGCASFDMFKDFYDRGNQFKQAVKELS